MVRLFRHPVNAADLPDRQSSAENPFTVKATEAKKSSLFDTLKENSVAFLVGRRYQNKRRPRAGRGAFDSRGRVTVAGPSQSSSA